MNTARKIITMFGMGAGLLAALTLLLLLASPVMALQPAELPIAPDQPLVWNAAAPIPQARTTGLVQCPDDPEGFYMVGGVTTGNITVDTLYHYDAISNTWTITLTTMPQPRRAVAAACYEGKIYVAGGWDQDDPKDSFYIYDIAGDSWSSGPSLPDILWGGALGAWGGKLYLVGGTRILSIPWTPVNRVDVYDIDSGVWTPGGGMPMPVPASFYGAVQRGPYLFAVGGISGVLNNNRNQTQRYDMSGDIWESGPEFTSQRAAVGTSMTGARLYAQGGDINGGGAFDSTDLVEYLELSGWPGGAWTDLGDPLPQANLYPSGACTEVRTGGEIWSVGGVLDFANHYSTNLYRPAEPCLGNNYALSLAPDAQSGVGYRGGTVDYTLTVTNTGDTPDAYTLAVTSTWTATVSGLGGALDPDQSRMFTITVEVPASAALGESDLASLTLISQGDPAQAASAALTTTAVQRYAVVLSPGAAEQVDYQGALVTHTLQLTNTGDVTDTFTLVVGEAGWTVTLPVTETTLTPGEGVAVDVLVAIPPDVPDGDMDVVVITATSQGDPLVFASSTLTTAVWRRTYLPLITSN